MKTTPEADEVLLKPAILLIIVAISFGCATPSQPSVKSSPEAAVPAVNTAVDRWHQAAASSDEDAYFGLMAPGFVFLGTDASERWTLPEFRAFAHPYFAQGKGWKFVPRSRHVFVSEDGATAWFDEALDSASYGDTRGTGVLRKLSGEWRIAHYNLTIPIPNALAKQVVRMIREQPAAPAQP